MNITTSIIVIAVALLFSTKPAAAGLIHRYTFQDGSAKDTVGQIDGKLVGGGAKILDGKLILKNDPTASAAYDSYVEFPSSPLPAKNSVSLVAWFTAKEGEVYPRIFDFGTRSGAEGINFIYFSPRTADGTARAAITATDLYAKTNVDFPPLDDEKLHMIAVVVNGPARILTVYADGKIVAKPQYLGDNTLDKVKPSSCWLGKSLFSDNPLFNGSIEEFRVYDHPLEAGEVAAAFQCGPNVLPKLPPSAE